MTECTAPTLPFSSHNRRAVVADFSGGTLTSDAGVLLLREADRQLGLLAAFDATDDPVHGQQEQRFFHGYYDDYCFLPLYVFCGDHLLVAYLRPANIDGARHSRAILRWLVERLRQAWPAVRIVVRADSGFCRWRMLRWCDRHGVDYLVGLARNPVLQ